MTQITAKEKTSCYHCGEECPPRSPQADNHSFCCYGCRAVYEILGRNKLTTYYDLESNPGVKSANDPDRLQNIDRFAYLDDESIRQKIVDYSDSKLTSVTFHIPAIHCSSCIWLLEKLHRFDKSITSSRVNFSRRELFVTFQSDNLRLSELVRILASIGYEPLISLDSISRSKSSDSTRNMRNRLAVAGFCFSNIMLLSLSDYFGFDLSQSSNLTRFFNYLSVLLSLPVLLYSASVFFLSSRQGLRRRNFNIDIPISIGIVVLYSRSLYEIIELNQSGFFDSFCGLVFFLLIGRFFQNKTYDALAFDRDYKSFFPLSVMVIRSGVQETIPITKLSIGDRIMIRNMELVPSDSVLLRSSARIDYSFVTGESEPVEKQPGDIIYAGGRIVGLACELETIKSVSQSHLTQLWNQASQSRSSSGQDKQEIGAARLSDRVALYFTPIILTLAAAVGLYWYFVDPSIAASAATAVLIVACPCALALAAPITLGTAVRVLGRNKMYVRDSSAIERMGKIDAIVFDKTGTLTIPRAGDISFDGIKLSENESRMVATLAKQSIHPMSMKIADSIESAELLDIESMAEYPGRGLEATIDGREIRLGSRAMVFETNEEMSDPETLLSEVCLSIDGEYRGRFLFGSADRPGIKSLLDRLKPKTELWLTSGDNSKEQVGFGKWFGEGKKSLFGQSPGDKRDLLENLNSDGLRTMMLGDGLNDAGALASADVGIAVTDDSAGFTPSSDAILEVDKVENLDRFITLSKLSLTIMKICFVISFMYNLFGLGFAMTGSLTPLIAALLMPISSITVVVIATGATEFAARRLGL